MLSLLSLLSSIIVVFLLWSAVALLVVAVDLVTVS